MLFCARTYHPDHLRYHQEPSRTPKRHTTHCTLLFSLLCSNTRSLSTTVFPTSQEQMTGSGAGYDAVASVFRTTARNNRTILNMRLSLLSLSLADLGRETGLDGGDGSPGAARVARHEVETVLTLVQLGVRATAGLASDVFNDISPQHVLNLLLLEPTLDD